MTNSVINYFPLDRIGSEVGEICVWKNKGSAIHDTISSHDSEKVVFAAKGPEFLQKLEGIAHVFFFLIKARENSNYIE